jgi:hypothetical protein
VLDFPLHVRKVSGTLRKFATKPDFLVYLPFKYGFNPPERSRD